MASGESAKSQMADVGQKNSKTLRSWEFMGIPNASPFQEIKPYQGMMVVNNP